MAKHRVIENVNGDVYFVEESGYYRFSDRPGVSRTGLPIYESFPEFVPDNWSEETRAAKKMIHQNVYLYDSRVQGNDGFYADRMRQWDAEKYEAAMAHLSGGLSHSSPQDYSAMLSHYVGHAVTVTQVIRMADTRGYDYWYFAFQNPRK